MCILLLKKNIIILPFFSVTIFLTTRVFKNEVFLQLGLVRPYEIVRSRRKFEIDTTILTCIKQLFNEKLKKSTCFKISK